MAHPDAAFAGKPQQQFEVDKLSRAALAACTSTTLHVAPGRLQGIVFALVCSATAIHYSRFVAAQLGQWQLETSCQCIKPPKEHSKQSPSSHATALYMCPGCHCLCDGYSIGYRIYTNASVHIDHATPKADHFPCLSQLYADVVLVGAFSNAATLSAVLSGAVSLSNRARLVQVCLMVMGSMVALLPCMPARTSPSGCQLTATLHPRIPKGASRPWRVCAVRSSEALHGRSCAALMPAAVV